MTYPNEAVVGHDTFDTLHLRIGQKVKVVYRFGGTGLYTVRGVVPDNAADSGFGSGLFSQFAMVDRSSVTSFMNANGVSASAVFLKTHDAGAATAVKKDIERHFANLINPKTVAEVQKDSANSAEGFNKFFRIMGLVVAVVIGGIGIINTMLVAAHRRMREIAVLKSIGMKGRQVVLVFTIESFILGIAGTAVGILLGILASIAVNNVTKGMAGYDIPWSIHPRPLVAGALVGIVATVLFAYLPVLRAGRARPVAAIVDEQMLKITPSFDWLTIIALVVLGMILAIGASALTALPASSEKPLRVLRYEKPIPLTANRAALREPAQVPGGRLFPTWL